MVFDRVTLIIENEIRNRNIIVTQWVRQSLKNYKVLHLLRASKIREFRLVVER